MEVVKFQQAQLINSDLDMYYPKTDTPALCRTSSLVEELGQIEYVFSDKTGTLTCNEMEFKCCSIAGVAYAETVDESKRADAELIGSSKGNDQDGWRTFQEMTNILGTSTNPFLDPAGRGQITEGDVIHEFLTLLAVCHTVIPEVKDGKLHYQASSPDEAALVAGAELLGFQFHVSQTNHFFPSGADPWILDPEAQVGLRKYSRNDTGIRGSQCLRVQLNKEADVHCNSWSRWEDQTVLQRR